MNDKTLSISATAGEPTASVNLGAPPLSVSARAGEPTVSINLAAPDRTPPDDGRRDWDGAPFFRLFNHVREQLPGWVEQAADWLSPLQGLCRARTRTGA